MLPRLDRRTTSLSSPCLGLLKNLSFSGASLLLIYWANPAGCRQVIPATYRSRRTCPPSTALKQADSGSVLQGVVVHYVFLVLSNLPHGALILVSPNPSPPGGVLTQPTPLCTRAPSNPV
ncbi:hypothetical protein ATANTOWER_016122 [Ataeniobius toweri]|uniref:Uncharacterized protein n=1 Tax=Ataeniobius toweri TaxID=208326 RepID=A0ABU7BT44_9TELE|nr:hypothetical protein [Ataeniobius toweri]